MDLMVKSLHQPDERPELPKGRAQIVHMGDGSVIRGELAPGWRYSNDWAPIFGQASCPVPHTGVVVSGRLHFEMDDGTAADLGPGDVYQIPPGHDAWVVGDEPVRSIDWSAG
jgi:hypothetical protein